MILDVYEKTQDRAWLESTLGAIDAYYAFWTTGRIRPRGGLSRYYDLARGRRRKSWRTNATRKAARITTA